MTELYIEGHRVDLSDKIDYSITKTYLDLSDPSKLCDDWSKTIKIPMTPANKRLFGHWEQVDRVTASSDENDSTGVYFNPYIKLHYQLFDLGQLIMEGDMRFSKSFYDASSRNYEVILYGNWNDTLNKLKTTSIMDIFNDVYPQDLRPVTAIKNYLNYTTNSERWKANLYDEYAGYIITLLGENYYKDFNSESFYHGVTESSARSSDMPIPILTAQELRLDKADSLMSIRVLFRVLEKYFKGKLLLDPQWFNSHNPYFTDTFYPFDMPLEPVDSEEFVGNYLHIDPVVRPKQIMVPRGEVSDVLVGGYLEGEYFPSGAVLKPELTVLGDGNAPIEAVVVEGNILCYRPDEERPSWPGETLNYEFLTNKNVAGTDDKRYTLQYKVKDTYYLSGRNIEFLEGSKITVSLPNTVSPAAGEFDYTANIQNFSIPSGATWSLSAIEGSLRVKMRINGEQHAVWYNRNSPLTLYIGGAQPEGTIGGVTWTDINNGDWWEIPTRTETTSIHQWQYSIFVGETVNVVNRTGTDLSMSGNNFYVRFAEFINNTIPGQGGTWYPGRHGAISGRPSVWMGEDVDDYAVFGTSNNTMSNSNIPDGIKLTMIVGRDQSEYNPESLSSNTNYADVYILSSNNILLDNSEWRTTHNYLVVNSLKTRLIHNSSYIDLSLEGISEGRLNALELPKSSVLDAPEGYVRNRCQFALTYNGEIQLTGSNLQGSYQMSNIAWQSANSALNLNIPISKSVNTIRTPYLISGLNVMELLTKYMRHFNLKLYTYNGHNIITTPNRLLSNGVYNKGIQIDYSSIEYAPVTHESTFITLGGEEDDNYLNIRFKRQYNKNYGEFKKKNLNEFAIEEKPVLETFTPTITSKVRVKQSSYNYNTDKVWFVPTGKLDEYNTVANMDETGDRIFSGKLLFHGGIKTLFDGSTSNITPAISISSTSMREENTYGYYDCYVNRPGICERPGGGLKITLMSEFAGDENGSVLTTNFVKSNVVFYKPSADPNSVYAPSRNIYGVQELCHRYIDELYGYDTRRAKAKAIVDMQKFNWGNLVNIQGRSFLVTKISNWNNNHSLCDVELVSIEDIENYKISDRILYSYDEVDTRSMGVRIDEDFIITVANSNGADISDVRYTTTAPGLVLECTPERIFDDYVVYKCRITSDGSLLGNSNKSLLIEIGDKTIAVTVIINSDL